MFSGTQLVRWAAIGALAAALGLSACGRKGPLDPPPGAAVPKVAAAPVDPALPPTIVLDSRGRPVELKTKRAGRGPVAAAPTGQQTDFFLDWLLD